MNVEKEMITLPTTLVLHCTEVTWLAKMAVMIKNGNVRLFEIRISITNCNLLISALCPFKIRLIHQNSISLKKMMIFATTIQFQLITLGKS